MSQTAPSLKTKIVENFPKFGVLGSIFVLGGSLITALGYTGASGESYSWLNHFISELGQVSVSELAWVFNICLILSGLSYLGFFVGLGQKFQTKLGKAAMIFGVIASIFCSLVGVFPMDGIAAHTTVAFSFFYSGMVAMLLFSIAILIDKQKPLPKFLTIPALISMICFALFLFMPQDMSELAGFLDITNYVRSDVLTLVVFEWLILFTVVAWILITSIYSWKKTSK